MTRVRDRWHRLRRVVGEAGMPRLALWIKDLEDMDVFEVHRQLVADYSAFTAGFLDIRDPRISRHVQERTDNGDQWPDPYLSLNPNFASGGSITEFVHVGLLHPECARIFRVGKDGSGAEGQVLDLHQ